MFGAQQFGARPATPQQYLSYGGYSYYPSQTTGFDMSSMMNMMMIIMVMGMMFGMMKPMMKGFQD
jgi:hypothetical protein